LANKKKHNEKKEDDFTMLPKPVELEYFTYTVFNCNIRLKWKSLWEGNNYGFEIQRNSGDEWKKVAFVPSYPANIYEYTDYNMPAGVYKYRLKHIDNRGKFEIFELAGEIEMSKPKNYFMAQNVPNPFHTITQIKIELPEEHYITLKVFDMSGREVAHIFNGFKASGFHIIEFKNESLKSGIYYYKLVAGHFSDTKIMTILR